MTLVFIGLWCYLINKQALVSKQYFCVLDLVWHGWRTLIVVHTDEAKIGFQRVFNWLLGVVSVRCITTNNTLAAAISWVHEGVVEAAPITTFLCRLKLLLYLLLFDVRFNLILLRALLSTTTARNTGTYACEQRQLSIDDEGFARVILDTFINSFQEHVTSALQIINSRVLAVIGKHAVKFKLFQIRKSK